MIQFTQLLDKNTGFKYSVKHPDLRLMLDENMNVHWFLGAIELIPTPGKHRVNHA